MKTAIVILLIVGLAGVAFGLWGFHTPQGRLQFDEMDGLYPLFAGFGGALLIIIAVALALISAIRSR